jgi:hypothetical protein
MKTPRISEWQEQRGKDTDGALWRKETSNRSQSAIEKWAQQYFVEMRFDKD